MTNPITAELREKDVPLMQSGAFKDTRAVIRKAADHIDAQDAKIKALVEALEWYEKNRLDAVYRVHSITASEDEAVKHLCERHGYGAVMDSAARQWAKKPHGSAAFFIGGCIGDEIARAAIAAAKEPT